jgi:folylpolyglutamate synthase/dihydropteroate synthase
MADKDVDGVIAALVTAAALDGATVVCTGLDLARAMPATDLATRWRAEPRAPRDIRVEPDPGAALDGALGGSGPVVVAGSLYLVGMARGQLVDDPDLRDPGHAADGSG